MIPIKIQCGCGQRYAFEVEPLQGRMPYAIACPSCGIDGTTAANESIAQSGSVLTATEAPPASVSTSSSRTSGRPTKEVDIIKVTNEARAKTMWGDSQEDVMKFLMMQGLPRAEATNLSKALFAERTSAVRGNGFRKILTGVAMMCVPVVAFVIFKAIGFFPIKLMGIAGAVGLWGAYLVLRGTLMFLSPKLESGDVGAQ